MLLSLFEVGYLLTSKCLLCAEEHDEVNLDAQQRIQSS
jgi:hypothetical protein